MKQIIIVFSFFILISLLLLSCSEFKEVIQEPYPLTLKNDEIPNTKAQDIRRSDCKEVLHLIQSDHYIMVINGVVFKDSTYVQTLTQKDMEVLGITEEERSFSISYLSVLNSKKELLEQ